MTPETPVIEIDIKESTHGLPMIRDVSTWPERTSFVATAVSSRWLSMATPPTCWRA